MEPLANKTFRAVTVLATMVFSASVVVWIVAYGSPSNGLHATALSWSYTLLGVALGALLGELAILKIWDKPSP